VGQQILNRVGSEGLLPSLSSHTTVRAVRHTPFDRLRLTAHTIGTNFISFHFKEKDNKSFEEKMYENSQRKWFMRASLALQMNIIESW